jgi:hypothetical protein
MAVRLDSLQQALLSVAIKNDWGCKYAKFSQKNNQSLLVHSLNAFSVARELASPIYGLENEEVMIGCLAAFLHDYQKAEDRWQNAATSFMTGERAFEDGSFDHDDGSEHQCENILHLLEDVEKEFVSLSESATITDLAERILNIVVYTHDTQNHAVAVRRRNQVGSVDGLVPLVRLADSIASIKEPREIVVRSKDLAIPPGKQVFFEYHEISLIRGLVTSFLNEALLDLMKELGWTPLLYFGNGVIYCSNTKPKAHSDYKPHLGDLLKQQVTKFQQSEIYVTGKTNAVVGPLTQTRWPALQIVKENDIAEIMRYLSGQPAMRKADSFGAEILSKANAAQKKAISEFLQRCGAMQVESGEALLAAMTSDFNLFIYFTAVLKGYQEYADQAGKGTEYAEKVQRYLTQNGFDFPLYDLFPLAVTAQTEKRLDVIAKLWDVGGRNLHLSHGRREDILNRIISVLKMVLRTFCNIAPALFTEEAQRLLMSDILHLPVKALDPEDFDKIALSAQQRYQDGKDQNKRICSFCGAEGIANAPAALFGDGSQKFSNYLPGGIKIGEGRKAQVCSLCLVESTFRAFYFPSSPATTFTVIPDLSLSPPISNQWAEGVKSFIRTEMVGLSSVYAWNMVRVYTALSRGESVNNASELASMLRPTKSSVDRLVKHLEAQWPDPSSIKYDILTEKSGSTFTEMAEAHLSGNIAIHPRYLEGFKQVSRAQGTAYMTPGHFFIFFRNPVYLEDNESASTISIRAYFLALIISKIFHARVIVTDGFKPISDFAMHGNVRIQVPAPASMSLASLGMSEETTLDELPIALMKLAALTLISMSYVEGLGKDRLLRLARMSRGAILRRAELENWRSLNQWQKRRLMGLLEVISSDFEQPSQGPKSNEVIS